MTGPAASVGESAGGGRVPLSKALRAAVMGWADIVTVFQPVVSLADANIVGYEALSRWPGLAGVSPEDVFAEAAAAGVLDELDRRCIESALDAAATVGLAKDAMLLINTEPATAVMGSATDRWLTNARDKHRLVFELTERDLLVHPAAALAKIATLRTAGVAIALDDVGSYPDALAWLDIIDPDLIKLDLSLIQRQPAPERARVLTALYGHCERSGALLLAEGIETDAHLERARAVGATLGQGYRFGPPVAHPAQFASTSAGAVRIDGRPEVPAEVTASTPFDLIRRSAGVRIAPKDLLTAFSRDIETRAEHATDRPILLIAVQHADYLPARTRDRYRRLAPSCSLVAVFGVDLPPDLGAGVMGIGLDAEDALRAEWTVIVLGTHTAFALLARELDAPVSSADARRFEFVMTSDRTLIAAAAANLISRMS